MGLWSLTKTFLASGSFESQFSRKLNAVSEAVLSRALKELPAGVQGWISFSEARTLFSSMDDQYAFGEMDEEGKANLSAFAANPEHQSTFDFMPAEDRIYFTRT